MSYHGRFEQAKQPKQPKKRGKNSKTLSLSIKTIEPLLIKFMINSFAPFI